MPGRPAPSGWRRQHRSWYSGVDHETHVGSYPVPPEPKPRKPKPPATPDTARGEENDHA